MVIPSMHKLLLQVLIVSTISTSYGFDFNNKQNISIGEVIDKISDGDSGSDIVNDILESYGLDGVVESVNSLNEIAQCFDMDIDIRSDVNIDGLCATFEKGIDLGKGGEIYACLTDQEPIDSIGLDLGFLCGLSDEKGSASGSGGEIKTEIGADGKSEINKNALDLGSSSDAVVGTAMLQNIGSGGEKSKEQPKEIKLPGKDSTRETIFGGDDGGEIYKEANENPSGAIANSINKQDIPTLYLTEWAKTTKGLKAEAGDMTLPENKDKLFLEFENLAKEEQKKAIDHNAITRGMKNSLRKKFSEIKADTLADYDKETVKLYKEYIAEDRFKELYLQMKIVTKIKYFRKMRIAEGEKGRIHDPTNTMASRIDRKDVNNFKFYAAIQNKKDQILYTNLAKEMKIKKELLDLTATRGYYASRIFRSDIAKKEIEELLKAVDQSVK